MESKTPSIAEIPELLMGTPVQQSTVMETLPESCAC